MPSHSSEEFMGSFSPNIIANYLYYIEKYNPEGEAVIYGENRIT